MISPFHLSLRLVVWKSGADRSAKKGATFSGVFFCILQYSTMGNLLPAVAARRGNAGLS